MDDVTITGTTVRIVNLRGGRFIRSVADVRVITGGVFLIITIYGLDPGQKSQIVQPAALFHNSIGVGADWQVGQPSNTLSSVGLTRIEYALSGPGSVTFSHSMWSEN